MPVILIVALGGMAAKGILGMFVSATLMALGYQISWLGCMPTRMPLTAVCRKTLPLQGRPMLHACSRHVPRRPLLAATSLLLSACAAVGPDFKPPGMQARSNTKFYH
jgi:hypothetical protein